jgi:hypothetical protein
MDEIKEMAFNLVSVDCLFCDTYLFRDLLCGLMVRVPGYRSRGPRFDSRRYEIFLQVVGLEWVPISLVSTTEELLGRKSSASDLERREYGHADPSR